MSEYAPVIILILETMMRGQEVLALTMDDIDLEKNIKVPIEGSDKIIKKGPRRVKARVCPVCGKVELYIDLNN